MLNHPSLAERLPNGLIAANDDYRARVVIIDPRTRKIVWQYGQTGEPGTGPSSPPPSRRLRPARPKRHHTHAPEHRLSATSAHRGGSSPSQPAIRRAVAIGIADFPQ